NHMTNKLLTKHKWFWAWQDEKEEAWLAEMARQGLHLNAVPFPGSYQFKNGEPADYVYRLDYQSLKTKERDSYLQLFADSGWEQVGEMGGWMYFRYKVDHGEAPEIYSNRESKIGKYQRVLTFLAILLPLMVVMMPNIGGAEGDGPFFIILEALAFAIMIFLSYGVIQLFRRINQLKKTI
ncbi:MAG: DUF2812 domain-containing protein, partial [Anaerolineales bacterium]|nr:DUF2812 domain-containing protein [Anaerolineales bacterium]